MSFFMQRIPSKKLLEWLGSLNYWLSRRARGLFSLGSRFMADPLPPASELNVMALGPGGYRRSVLFLHNSYYHFLYLAEALRRRGWDALSVSLEPSSGPNESFYHGEDVNLYHEDPATFTARLQMLVKEIPRRFRMVHFAGDGMMSVFPSGQDVGPRREAIPWDFIALKRAGVKIGYTVAGCNDGIAQSSFSRWSERSCDKCTLKGRADVCSDLRNLAWGHKREMFCDLIATEMLPALDYCSGPKTFREPLTMSLDPEVWRPDLEVPTRHRIERNPSDILVYHGVGNYFNERYLGNRDYKGTWAVKLAIERLQAEGYPVRLIFVHDVPSREVRFLQVQVDIVVDQLNCGRYGANARECLMLGKPVVGNVRLTEENGIPPLVSLAECPIVHATEETVETVLRELIRDPERRRKLGCASRAYALKWHAADAAAARFEPVYDWILSGHSPNEAPVIVPELSVISTVS